VNEVSRGASGADAAPDGRGVALKVRILFVEDEGDDVQLMLRRLRRDGFEPEGEVVVSEAQLRQALSADVWQVALVDYHLPGFGGLEAAAIIAELAPDLPVITVSGVIDEEIAVQTMRAGAVDYVLKQNLARLGHAVRRAVEEAGLRRGYRTSLESARATHFALDNASFPVTMLAADGTIVYANERAVQLTGFLRTRLVGAKLWECDVHQSPEQFQAYWNEVCARGVLYEERIAADAQGGDHVLEVTSNYLEREGEPVVVTYTQDITEARRLQDQALESEARFSSLAAHVPGLVMLIQQDGTVTYANRMAQEKLAPGNGRLVGRNLKDFLPEHVMSLVRGFGRQVGAGDTVDAYIGYPGEEGEDTFHVVAAPIMTQGTTTAGVIALDESALWRAEDSARATAERLRRTLQGSVLAMSQVVETRDPYTAGHERRVAELAGDIAVELGWSGEKLAGLRLGALIHDIGKIAVPAEILSKPGRLSEAEFNLIKQHSQAGSDILASIEFDSPVAQMVLQHHEREDGSGYPQGLTAEAILPQAKILAVADVVEAMSSHRPYRPALGMEPALEEIESGAGLRYDAAAARACVRVVRELGFTFSS
jgi:PAS domain S-box-containing protein/putative nucleotidyltransferase with HDIG domain